MKYESTAVKGTMLA